MRTFTATDAAAVKALQAKRWEIIFCVKRIGHRRSSKRRQDENLADAFILRLRGDSRQDTAASREKPSGH